MEGEGGHSSLCIGSCHLRAPLLLSLAAGSRPVNELRGPRIGVQRGRSDGRSNWKLGEEIVLWLGYRASGQQTEA